MKIAVFDTETTGLPLPSSGAALSLQPYIIEFAIAHIEDGKVTTKFETLIKPPIPLPEIITKITGVTDEDLKDAPTFAEVLPMIRVAMEGDILIAHNAPFDTALLGFELARLMVDDFVWPLRTECTVQLYMEEYGRRVKMLELYELKLGKPLAQKHRAMDDVDALCEIIIHEKLWEVFK